MNRAALALALAACGTPTPQIKLKLAKAPSQACPAECSMIPLPCEAVMSIRIIDPSDAEHPVKLDQCSPVSPNVKHDVCSLNQVGLEKDPIPVRDLVVQIAVFPGGELELDGAGMPVCPVVQFNDSTGLPVEQAQAPVLGGQAYYHPGDSIVEVTLGCTDLSAMRAGDTCRTPSADSLTATVDDFDTRVPVTQAVADRLFVSVGEPHLFDGGYVLNPRDAIPLQLDDDDVPRWSAAADPRFTKYACAEVREDKPQTIAALRCAPVADPLPELGGIWISRDRLKSVLDSLQLTEFPDEGLTVGMVVDTTAKGAANYTVKPSGTGSVVYMSDTGVVGGSATSESGIFVSRDAPFGTKFAATGASTTVPAVGGLVEGKVTIVIVPFAAAR